MSTEVICEDCGTVLERYEDDDPYREVLERCDKCERALYEAERAEALYEFEEMWP